MNAWLFAATALLVGLVPCGVALLRGTVLGAAAALQLAGGVDALVLLLLAEGLDRPALFDLALVLAVLSFAGGLAFARFLERWT